MKKSDIAVLPSLSMQLLCIHFKCKHTLRTLIPTKQTNNSEAVHVQV